MIHRRTFLRTAGALSLTPFLPGGSLANAASAVLAKSCTLTGAQPQGPFYQGIALLRQDLSEMQLGLRMTLMFRVVRASDCSPVAGAFVDVWHNNASGTYSGFAVQGTAGETWLRGVQITDARGFVRFETLYPGWYPGRTTHLHAKVWTPPDVFTTQFYLPDDWNLRVQRGPIYSGANPLLNADDSDYAVANELAVRPLGFARLPFAGGRARRVLAGATIALA